ncbi:ferritin family protein [Chloroflexota bacterium]
METEQKKTEQALKMAIQMEVDGKKYYRKASGNSANQLGRELFQSLADEEDVHRRKFEEIYAVIHSKQGWPATDFQPDRGKRLKTIFSRAVEELNPDTKTPATEIDAAETAMNMENKTFDFYQSQAGSAAGDAERAFYETLAAEEREHHMVLLDYYEYLNDPASWFVQKEHPSLDGG